MSPGEFNSSNQDAIPNIEPIPMHHPSVLDSDENNNASEQSSSISEVQNQVRFHLWYSQFLNNP